MYVCICRCQFNGSDVLFLCWYVMCLGACVLFVCICFDIDLNNERDQWKWEGLVLFNQMYVKAKVHRQCCVRVSWQHFSSRKKKWEWEREKKQTNKKEERTKRIKKERELEQKAHASNSKIVYVWINIYAYSEMAKWQSEYQFEPKSFGISKTKQEKRREKRVTRAAVDEMRMWATSVYLAYVFGCCWLKIHKITLLNSLCAESWYFRISAWSFRFLLFRRHRRHHRRIPLTFLLSPCFFFLSIFLYLFAFARNQRTDSKRVNEHNRHCLIQTASDYTAT